ASGDGDGRGVGLGEGEGSGASRSSFSTSRARSSGVISFSGGGVGEGEGDGSWTNAARASGGFVPKAPKAARARSGKSRRALMRKRMIPQALRTFKLSCYT